MYKIQCVKLKKEAEGMDKPPLPGDLGKKIHTHVSKEAWQMWLAHQTMLINEYRLSMLDTKSRQFLLQEMEKFFFKNGSTKPPGFVETT